MGINSRRLGIVALAAAALLSLSACSGYPEQHQERLRKAAGVVTFRIHCVKDLWERTRTFSDWDPIRPRRVADEPGGTVMVELTGPQLVDYLGMLAAEAFPLGSTGDPLAQRMYNALAPEVDKIRGPLKPGDPVPEVSVNDAVAPVPSATASPAASKSK